MTSPRPSTFMYASDHNLNSTSISSNSNGGNLNSTWSFSTTSKPGLVTPTETNFSAQSDAYDGNSYSTTDSTSTPHLVDDNYYTPAEGNVSTPFDSYFSHSNSTESLSTESISKSDHYTPGGPTAGGDQYSTGFILTTTNSNCEFNITRSILL